MGAFQSGRRRRIDMKTAEDGWPAPRVKRPDPRAKDMTIAEFIRYKCKDRRSTLRYFKLAGLTYDKKGNPVVVPR